MRFCIFCGVEIPRDASYCQICSKEQPLAEESLNSSHVADEIVGDGVSRSSLTKLIPKSQVAKIMLVAGVFILLIVILTMVIMMAVKH